MNLAESSFKRPTSVFILSALLLVAGVSAFQGLGRLEDPAFTIKTALVMTRYPGASAQEVQVEVTEVIEEAVQALGQLKELRSISKPAASRSAALGGQ